MSDELCSPEHAKRLADLHAKDPNFGVIGNLWAERVAAYMEFTQSRTLLDYGCGRANLAAAVCEHTHVDRYAEYDPAVRPGDPQPADFVTCIDVLEHVESDKLIAVLCDLQRLALKGLLITISLRNSARKSVHPNVKTREEWMLTLSHFWGHINEVQILDPTKAKSELAVLIRTNK